MMKRLLLVALLCAGCAHLDEESGTFSQRAGGPMVLKLDRHMDTIANGPDIEEDQTLTLEVRRVEVGKRFTIPSDDVVARFDVKRFGPSSTGKGFKGYLIVKKVEKDAVVAEVNLVVEATTADGSYKETARFRGDHTFLRELR